MPEVMSAEARRQFLTSGKRNAVVATTRADGRPHAVPVWYALDGDDVLINIGEGTAKGVDMQRDARVAVVVEDPTPPYAFVMIEGDAEITHDPAEIREGTLQIGRHYLDEDAARQFAEYGSGPGKVVVRIRPTNVVALDQVAG